MLLRILIIIICMIWSKSFLSNAN